MADRLHVAVIDIGKTNAKLALVDLGTLTEIEVRKRPNMVPAGPPLHLSAGANIRCAATPHARRLHRHRHHNNRRRHRRHRRRRHRPPTAARTPMGRVAFVRAAQRARPKPRPARLPLPRMWRPCRSPVVSL